MKIPIRPRVVTVSQFADVNESKLADYDCIYLCDVSKLTMGDVKRLEAHLRRGGGVVVALGDRVADGLEGYNRLLFKKGDGAGIPVLPRGRGPTRGHRGRPGREA